MSHGLGNKGRLLVVTSGLLPLRHGGMAVFSSSYLQRMRARGWDVRAISLADTPHNWRSVKPGVVTDDGSQVYYLPETNLHTRVSAGALFGLAVHVWLETLLPSMGQWQPDLVHIHVPPHIHALCGWAVAEWFGAPTILTSHSVFHMEDSGRGSSVIQALCEQADRVTAVSEAVATAMEATCGASMTAPEVIWNGTDDPGRSLSLPSEFRQIAAIGRFAWPKRWDQAIEAFALIAQDCQPCRLALVGDGEDKPRMTELVHDLGVVDQVTFTGWLSSGEVNRVVHESRSVILVSDSEALGLTLLEGCAAGRPVIGSAVGGIPEVIQDAVNGLLVPPGDVKALAATLKNLLSDDAMCDEYGRAGRAIFDSKFSWDSIMSRYDALLKEVCRSADGNVDSSQTSLDAFLDRLSDSVESVFCGKPDLTQMASEFRAGVNLRRCWNEWCSGQKASAQRRMHELAETGYDSDYWVWAAETLAADSEATAEQAHSFWQALLSLCPLSAGERRKGLRQILSALSYRLMVSGRRELAAQLAWRALKVKPSLAGLASLVERSVRQSSAAGPA